MDEDFKDSLRKPIDLGQNKKLTNADYLLDDNYKEDLGRENKYLREDRKPVTKVNFVNNLKSRVQEAEREINKAFDMKVRPYLRKTFDVIKQDKNTKIEEAKIDHSLRKLNRELKLETKNLSSLNRRTIKKVGKEQKIKDHNKLEVLKSRIKSKSEELNNLLTDKRSNKTDGLLKKIADTNKTMLSYNTDVGHNYARKSLELQYRQLYVIKDLLNVTRESVIAQNTQLNAIVKNTSLPDILKTRQSEFLRADFMKKMRDFLHDKLFAEDGLYGNMVRNTKRKFQDFSEETNKYFYDLIQRSFIGGSLAKEGKKLVNNQNVSIRNQTLNYLANKVFNTDARRSLLVKAKQFKENPSEFFEEIRGGIDDNSKKGKFLRETLRLGANVSNRNLSLMEAFVDKEELNNKAEFDGRTKNTIIYAIPGYLRKIHAEIRADRLNYTDRDTKNFEILFNYANNKFIDAKSFGSFIKEDIKMLRDHKIRKEVEPLKKLLTANGFTDEEADKFKDLLIATTGATKKRGMDIFNSRAFKNNIDPEMKEKVSDFLNRTKRSNLETLYLENIIGGIRGKTPDFNKMLYDYVKDGYADHIEDFVSYNDKNKKYRLESTKLRQHVFDPETKYKNMDFLNRFLYEKSLKTRGRYLDQLAFDKLNKSYFGSMLDKDKLKELSSFDISRTESFAVGDLTEEEKKKIKLEDRLFSFVKMKPFFFSPKDEGAQVLDSLTDLPKEEKETSQPHMEKTEDLSTNFKSFLGLETTLNDNIVPTINAVGEVLANLKVETDNKKKNKKDQSFKDKKENIRKFILEKREEAEKKALETYKKVEESELKKEIKSIKDVNLEKIRELKNNNNFNKTGFPVPKSKLGINLKGSKLLKASSLPFLVAGGGAMALAGLMTPKNLKNVKDKLTNKEELIRMKDTFKDNVEHNLLHGKDERRSVFSGMFSTLGNSKMKETLDKNLSERRDRINKEASKESRLAKLANKVKLVNGQDPSVSKANDGKSGKDKGGLGLGLPMSLTLAVFTGLKALLGKMGPILGGLFDVFVKGGFTKILKPLIDLIPSPLSLGKKLAGGVFNLAKGGLKFLGKAAFGTDLAGGLYKGVGKVLGYTGTLVKSFVKDLTKITGIVTKQLIKRVGAKIASKLTAKMLLRLTPGIGTAFLAYEAYRTYKFMNEGLSFKSAVCKAIFFFDPWDDESVPLDDKGEPVKTQEVMAEEEKLNKKTEASEEGESFEDKISVVKNPYENEQEEKKPKSVHNNKTLSEISEDQRFRNVDTTKRSVHDTKEYIDLTEFERKQSEERTIEQRRKTFNTEISRPSIYIDNSNLEKTLKESQNLQKSLLEEAKYSNVHLQTIISLLESKPSKSQPVNPSVNINGQTKQSNPNALTSVVPQPSVAVNRKVETRPSWAENDPKWKNAPGKWSQDGNGNWFYTNSY